MVVASLEGCDKWISKLFRSYPLLQTPWVSLHSWCSIFTYALRLMSWEHVDKYVKQTWGQNFAILHIQLRTWNVWASHSGQSGISSPNRKQTQAVWLCFYFQIKSLLLFHFQGFYPNSFYFCVLVSCFYTQIWFEYDLKLCRPTIA